MRYPDSHLTAVRQRLITAASRLVRRRGVDGTTVGGVMGKVKMTVGGFYRHFASREELVGLALHAAMVDARARLFGGLEALRGAAWERALVERYLSETHYRSVELGCPVAATVSELPRLSAAARRPLLDEIDALVAEAAAQLEGPDARARVWSLLSFCVGAMGVARAVGGAEGLALLTRSRHQLLTQLNAELDGPPAVSVA